MQLKSIKLAGFKSFVDPTTVHIPTHLVGIVGPNGCGKSNVIDAVRWVMGESSAKHLRGEAMTDVIFNGSNTRKPIGKASVELVFDNSDGSLHGEYANYSEISVKRSVTRDSQSTYFLNGTKCRRRDIVDIFLGTGLGPRSYSIIEQGMISRLIEAKPEELRSYLEEAAGISKYKERRRETENRIKHTEENLNRLHDIREELEKQLRKLDAQAKAAERYKALKAAEREETGKLNAIRYQVSQEKAVAKKQDIDKTELQLEEKTAELGSVDSSIEKTKVQLTEENEAFNQVQGKYYEVGSEIARIEQNIQHISTRERELKNDLSSSEHELKLTCEQIQAEEETIKRKQAVLVELKPQLEAVEATVAENEQAVQEKEAEIEAWQKEWDEFNATASKANEEAHIQKNTIEHAENHLQRIAKRHATLITEFETLTAHQDDSIEPLECVLTELCNEETALSEKQTSIQHKIDEQKNTIQSLTESLKIAEKKSFDVQKQLASLEAIQAVALGKENNEVVQWLENHGLATNQRLVETIKVQPGFEKAVETVLGDFLEAVCLDDATPVSELIDSFSQGAVTLVTPRQVQSDTPLDDTERLSSKIQGQDEIKSLLTNVYIADDLSQALSLREQLKPHQSVVTADGVWMGASWLRLTKSVQDTDGVFAREEQIRDLNQQLADAHQQIEQLEAELADAQQTHQEYDQTRGTLQSEIARVNQSLRQKQSELSAKKAKLEQINQRLDQTKHELREGEKQQQSEEAQLRQARSVLEQALNRLEEAQTQRANLQAKRETHQQVYRQLKETLRDAKDRAHRFEIDSERLSSELAANKKALERLVAQKGLLSEKQATLNSTLSDSMLPLDELKDALNKALQRRVDVEAKLADARKTMEQTESSLKSLEKRRHEIEHSLQGTRDRLGELRLQLQALDMKVQGFIEAVTALDLSMDEIIPTIASDETESELTEKLAKTKRSIERLGPINLVAIEEFEKQSERKTYLDSQVTDLESALETLQTAIKKIDSETKARFKETFDAVNSSLKELFPRVFGGGYASLQMTGDDLLDTGVSITARPPGKRNSSIHMLSGGEKALTAIALVFSIFQLNPSPFCMLDEVDAPLDDANVGRFCDLIKAMSEKVQFIFITHNKITMELATHLMGVTTNEPGVSRMVAVDIDEAAEMADA